MHTYTGTHFVPTTLAELLAMDEFGRRKFFKENNGIQSRAAVKADVHQSVVSKVANGKTTSAKVQRALDGSFVRCGGKLPRAAQSDSWGSFFGFLRVRWRAASRSGIVAPEGSVAEPESAMKT